MTYWQDSIRSQGTGVIIGKLHDGSLLDDLQLRYQEHSSMTSQTIVDIPHKSYQPGMKSEVPCGDASGSSAEPASVWPTSTSHIKRPGYPKRQRALHLENKAVSGLAYLVELPMSISSLLRLVVSNGVRYRCAC